MIRFSACVSSGQLIGRDRRSDHRITTGDRSCRYSGRFTLSPSTGQLWLGRANKGSPSVMTASLECIKSPHTVCILKRPALSFVLAAVDPVGDTDLLGPLPLVRKRLE
jgi:hypothetical protein